MNIENATEFKVDVTVSGMPGIGSALMSRFLKLDIFRPRSSALICRKSERKPRTTYRDIVFGERKDGDFIVYTERNNISATETHLPRHNIAFKDDNVVLTSALIRLNVSEHKSILLIYFTYISQHGIYNASSHSLESFIFTRVLILLYLCFLSSFFSRNVAVNDGNSFSKQSWTVWASVCWHNLWLAARYHRQCFYHYLWL